MIDLEDHHLAAVRGILRAFLPGREVRAFGSRVSGRARRYSDLDLVIMGDRSLPISTLEDLRDAFAASDLPMTVEVLDWHGLPGWLRQVVNQRHECVQQAAAPDDARGAGPS